MTSNYLTSSRQEIQNWELRGPGWLSQVSDFVLWPAQKAAETLIPKGVADKVGQAIEMCLNGAMSASVRTIDFAAIQKTVGAGLSKSASLSDRLSAADKEARSVWNWNLSYAAGEGAATGAAGLVGLAADIPALFTVTLRMIMQIGACYGYDAKLAEEREYVLQILRTASAGELKTKLEALIFLKEVEQILLSLSWRRMGADLAAKQLSKLSMLAATRQLAKTLGMDLTKRKALQMVPLIGALVGASFNATFANEVGQAAYMSYRRRWITQHGLPHEKGGEMNRAHPEKARPPKRLAGVRGATARPARTVRTRKIPARAGSKG